MQLRKLVLSTILALGASFAQASTIQIETGSFNAGAQADAAAYMSAVEAALDQSAFVTSYDNILPQNLGLSGSNFSFKSTINFGVSAANAGTWEIRSGVDFGQGGAIFVDGVAKDFKTNDMWWNGSYTDPTQYFDIKLSLNAGNHVVSIYGLEGCCSGGQQAQFKIGDGNFTSFSSTDNLVAAVPEPETYAMLMAGLGLMGFVARRRKQ